MSNITSRFNFIGTLVRPKSEKKPFFKEQEITVKKKKRNAVSMNIGIKESDSNMAFVEAFDSVQEEILTLNSDGEKIAIKWDDRFDEDSIKAVANYKKYTVDLGEELGGRKEFITLYDALLHLHDNLPKYEGKICVTGQFVKESYNGQYYDKFKIQNVYAVDAEQKSRLALTMDVFYNKDCIDKTDFKENKKIYLNGYVNQYIDKDEKNKYIPHQLIFNSSKYDMENEKHKKLFDYKMQYIDVTNKTMVHIVWDVVLVRGAETVEFDESMLTKAQKQQIELGIKTLDDFKPKGQIFGDKINEYRLFDPKLTGDFADGLVDTEMKFSEFEELIYVPKKEENLDKVIKESKETKEKSEEVKDAPKVDDEDLF